MMRYIKLLFLFFFGAYSGSVIAQDIPVPLDNGVYDYISRMSAKGITDLDGETKPWSREYTAKKINEIKNNAKHLSETELELLHFFKKEYETELARFNNGTISTQIHYLEFQYPERFRFFKYSDSVFAISAEPMLAYEFGQRYGEFQLERHNGINVFGNISNIGFYTSIVDNREEGKNLDISRQLSEKTGLMFRKILKESVEYDYVNGGISYSWNWGSLGVHKNYLEWGSGERGQLIFSQKAPSFPFIQLKVSPVDWFEFNYIHGWLNSGIIDSVTKRINTNASRLHYSMVDKFIVSHLFTFRPFGNLSVSLGESVIYSDNIEPIYFIPVLSLRMADHYVMNRDDNTGGNAQIFADIKYRNKQLRSIFYISLFVDELTISNVFNNDPAGGSTQAAFTVGGKIIDPFIKNSELVVEYTRINPYVYIHSDDAQFYSNYSYQLGHWTGSNSDLIYSKITHYLKRNLLLQLWGEYQRKGYYEHSSEDVKLNYPNFLYGTRKNMLRAGAEAVYEPVYSLKASLKYIYSNISDEDLSRTMQYEAGKTSQLTLALSYGF